MSVLAATSRSRLCYSEGTGTVSMRAMASAIEGVSVIAHRGGRGTYPENTGYAVQAAVDDGVDGVELDLGMTADGQLVLNHDRSLNPDITRDRHGCWLQAPLLVSELRSEEIGEFLLGRMRPGSRYADRFPKQRTPAADVSIPTLREILTGPLACVTERFVLMLEIKTSPEAPGETFAPDAFIRALADELDHSQTRCQVAVASFDWRNLLLARDLLPAARRIFLSTRQPGHNTVDGSVPGQPSPWLASEMPGPGPAGLPELVRRLGGDVWAPNHRDVDAESVAAAKERGLGVYCWTVNRRQRLSRVVELGVDALITDYPRQALRFIAGMVR
ncbi:glycerophosphodiester phosphodiesterase family protein [Xanthomonas chitinilytica]|nr:glycerophosphodiester phosphodiesterase family protein [Xanthomonas sp. H13-6]